MILSQIMKKIFSLLGRSFIGFALLILFSYASCKYGFKDVSPIPEEVKTFRVTYLENKAQYINGQLSPQLTDRLRQKIINTTRLKQTSDDDAHYDIGGYVSQFFVTTSGIANGNASENRLNVGFHLSFKNNLDKSKNQETDITRTYPFPSSQSLSAASNLLLTDIVRDISDDVFNKIFSNW